MGQRPSKSGASPRGCDEDLAAYLAGFGRRQFCLQQLWRFRLERWRPGRPREERWWWVGGCQFSRQQPVGRPGAAGPFEAVALPPRGETATLIGRSAI
jgi:hypothetical protein